MKLSKMFNHLKDHKLNAIQVSSGTYTHVEISRSFNFMLPKPYSSCVLDEQMTSNKFYNLITKSGYLYTQELCLTQCQQDLIIEECNCSDPNCSEMCSRYSDLNLLRCSM